MIEVNYFGRFGNNLFQYCLGRILATELQYELCAKPIPGFPNTYTKIRGHNYSRYPTQILTGHLIDLPSIIRDKTRRHIIFKYGLFQRYEYYKKYKRIIRNNWLLTDRKIPDLVDPEDIMMCIRRDDYVPYNALPMSYYEDILGTVSYRQAHICTDSPNDPFVIHLQQKYRAVVRDANTWENFLFIQKFNKIIIANSSFFWWAAFLSKANIIYTPIPKQGYWSLSTDIRLEIDDEKRYVSIPCREVYEQSIREKIIALNQQLQKLFHKTPALQIKSSKNRHEHSFTNINREAQIKMIVTIISILQKYNISYVLSDVWSLMYYGLNPTDRDIDFILDSNTINLNMLTALKSDLTKILALSLIQIGNSKDFRLVTKSSSIRLNIYIHLSCSLFDTCCLYRKKEMRFNGTLIYFASAENAIIQRLRWYQKKPRSKHLFNAAFIYHEVVQNINPLYLYFWLMRFHLMQYAAALKNTEIIKYF